MLVFGLGHKARHGKDFAGRAMATYAASIGLNARVYGFADALKAYCRVAFGMKKKDPRLLQLVGTELFRGLNPNTWVDVLQHTIEEQNPDVAIITDMRFPNELDMVRGMGGF